MDRKEVEKITLEKQGASTDPITGKPHDFRVIGLPPHLTATISGTDQGGYKYKLKHGSELYEQNRSVRTPETAFEALKKLLTWEGP